MDAPRAKTHRPKSKGPPPCLPGEAGKHHARRFSFDARWRRWQLPAMNRTNKRKKTVGGSGLSAADLMFYMGLGMIAAGAGFVAALFIPGMDMSHKGHAPSAAPAPVLGTFVKLAEPRAAEVLSFTDADGKPHQLADWRGKVVLLNLWATWCAPCKVEMPSLDRLQAKLGGDGFTVLALSLDRTGIEKPAEFFKGNSISHLAVYNDADSTATNVFRVSGLPVSVILDGAGREVARLTGPADWDNPATIGKVEEFIRSAGGKG
jgi:thiol-disulfide isomerase/thioredoxin